jgi:hypothetical protein
VFSSVPQKKKRFSEYQQKVKGNKAPSVRALYPHKRRKEEERNR